MAELILDELAQRMIDEPIWFRVEAASYAITDDWGDVVGSHRYLTVRKLKVMKHTPKGAWLSNGFFVEQRKFVLRDVQHRGRLFAAPTLDQAKEDFRLRKQFRIDRLQSQINRALKEIELLNSSTIHTIE